MRADARHLELVKQGTGAINEWRRHSANAYPNGDLLLAGVNLRGVVLNGADLTAADLTGADMRKAQLRGAYLTAAVLDKANLAGADLSYATLEFRDPGYGLVGRDNCGDAGFVSLRDANLRGASLRRAFLQGAILDGADLSDVDLREALLVPGEWFDLNDCPGAPSLRGVNLRRARLEMAQLHGANVREADLCEANLVGAVMRGVQLSSADLSGCISGGTVYAAMDLSEVRGLASIDHRGPSSVGTETLSLSKGRLPEVFLRGCGLSDWEIELGKLYNRGLCSNDICDIQQRVFDLRAGSPIQISSLFISYAHEDEEFVDALEEKLNARRIRFWRYARHATGGPIDKVIDRAIRLNPTVLLVLSRHSVVSDWVEDEASRARKAEREFERHVLCPIALDDSWERCDWSQVLRTQIKKYNVLSFHKWREPAVFEKMFSQLVAGLSLYYAPADPSGKS